MAQNVFILVKWLNISQNYYIIVNVYCEVDFLKKKWNISEKKTYLHINISFWIIIKL